MIAWAILALYTLDALGLILAAGLFFQLHSRHGLSGSGVRCDA